MDHPDRSRPRTIRLLPTVAAVGGLVGAMVTFAPAAGADVSRVGGGAFGYSVSVSLFGGAAQTAGPAPKVDLPPSGSSTPVTATEPSGKAQFGPATVFESGQLKVSTAGTTGPNGSVTSSATIAGTPNGPGPVRYGSISSTCTAKESGATASTSIQGGKLDTKTDKNSGDPVNTEDIPASPSANLQRSGTLDQVGDSFRVVFNEQKQESGGITVNAVHIFLLGPTAKGDVIIGQSRCSTNGAASSPGSTAKPPSASSGSGTASTGSGGSTAASTSGGGGGMPNTGAPVARQVLLGTELVLVGSAAVLWVRRRRPWPRG